MITVCAQYDNRRGGACFGSDATSRRVAVACNVKNFEVIVAGSQGAPLCISIVFTELLSTRRL